MPIMPLALNIALFQLGWFACVLGAAHGYAWLGGITTLVIVTIHLARAPDRVAEAGLIASAGILGAIFESLLMLSGLVHYRAGIIVPGLAPHWMVALWLLFATSCNVSLRWLKNRLWLSATVGAVAGPAAYYAGQRLGAIEFPAPGPALLAIGLGWAVLLPALIALAQRLDGFRPVSARARLGTTHPGVHHG
jgi:hypothetical protein